MSQAYSARLNFVPAEDGEVSRDTAGTQCCILYEADDTTIQG